MNRQHAPHRDSPLYWSAESWAFIALRLFLGLRLLLAGWGKFSGPNGFAFSHYYEGFVAQLLQTFTAATALPRFVLAPFAYTIGYVEIALGILLLAGIKTKYVLALIALTFVSLAFGKMLLSESPAIADIGVHLLITAAALYFVRHNKLEALR